MHFKWGDVFSVYEVALIDVVEFRVPNDRISAHLLFLAGGEYLGKYYLYRSNHVGGHGLLGAAFSAFAALCTATRIPWEYSQ